MTARVPSPGSNEAIARGCTCAVLDNCHGRLPPIPAGAMGTGPDGGWYITVGCPVHCPAKRGLTVSREFRDEAPGRCCPSGPYPQVCTCGPGSGCECPCRDCLCNQRGDGRQA